MVKIYAIGGYSEVGKNMTAVEINEDVFIFDDWTHGQSITAAKRYYRPDITGTNKFLD